MLIKGEYVVWGWIEGETPTEGAKRPKIEGGAQTEGEARNWAGEEFGEGLGGASPQNFVANSYLKLCNLVYSWSENSSFTTPTFLSLTSCICAVKLDRSNRPVSRILGMV